MKRHSRIVLTCLATTGAVTGAGFAISSVAIAANGAAPVTSAASPAAPNSAERAELERQSLLLQTQISRLGQQIAVERRGAARVVSVRPTSPPSAAGWAQQASPASAVAYAAPIPSPDPAPVRSMTPAVAAPTIQAPAPPAVTMTAPVHTTTGASGAAAAGHESTDGGSDD